MYIPALGAIACLFALGALIWQTVLASPFKFLILIALIGSAFAIEKAYNLYTGRKIKPLIKPTGRMKTKNRSESENLKS